MHPTVLSQCVCWGIVTVVMLFYSVATCYASGFVCAWVRFLQKRVAGV